MDCYSPEMNFLGLQDLSGLSLANVFVLPHYSKFITRFEQFEETCSKFEKEHKVNVIRINDGEGVFVEEGTICKV